MKHMSFFLWLFVCDRDGDLARRIGVATALEVRASGIHYTFAPCVAVSYWKCYLLLFVHIKFCNSSKLITTTSFVFFGNVKLIQQAILCWTVIWFWQVGKDPRWGRYYESYSEETEIVRKMTSIVSGLQGQPPKEHPKGYPYVAGR